jgi:hypothetical protein
LRLALTSAVAAWVTIGLLVARAVEAEARRRLQREHKHARAVLVNVLDDVSGEVGIDTTAIVASLVDETAPEMLGYE